MTTWRPPTNIAVSGPVFFLWTSKDAFEAYTLYGCLWGSLTENGRILSVDGDTLRVKEKHMYKPLANLVKSLVVNELQRRREEVL